MKKFFSLLAVMAFLTMATRAWAVDPVLPVAQKAYATFSDTTALSVEFDLYTHQDGKEYTFGTGGNYTTTTESIQFDVSTVTPGKTYFNGETPEFAKGTVFARVQTNAGQKKAGTSILMFTKNTTNDNGDYKVKYDNGAQYQGLIRKTNTSTFAIGDNAPIEMRFFVKSAAPTTYPTTMNIEADNGNEKYIADQAQTGYTTAESKIGRSGQAGGIWGGTNEYGDYYGSDMIIFFGAWFKTVFDGDEFGTESINVVTATE